MTAIGAEQKLTWDRRLVFAPKQPLPPRLSYVVDLA
jgi:hypothetical protein